MRLQVMTLLRLDKQTQRFWIRHFIILRLSLQQFFLCSRYFTWKSDYRLQKPVTITTLKVCIRSRSSSEAEMACWYCTRNCTWFVIPSWQLDTEVHSQLPNLSLLALGMSFHRNITLYLLEYTKLRMKLNSSAVFGSKYSLAKIYQLVNQKNVVSIINHCWREYC